MRHRVVVARIPVLTQVDRIDVAEVGQAVLVERLDESVRRHLGDVDAGRDDDVEAARPSRRLQLRDRFLVRGVDAHRHVAERVEQLLRVVLGPGEEVESAVAATSSSASARAARAAAVVVATAGREQPGPDDEAGEAGCAEPQQAPPGEVGAKALRARARRQDADAVISHEGLLAFSCLVCRGVGHDER